MIDGEGANILFLALNGVTQGVSSPVGAATPGSTFQSFPWICAAAWPVRRSNSKLQYVISSEGRSSATATATGT